jgi:hypothetical protein
LPIYKNASNPKNTTRDVFIGFFLVFLTYTFCGAFGYIGFSNRNIFQQVKIEQNFLN